MALDDVTVLGTVLRPRRSCLGYGFVEGYAALLAQTLHAQRLFVIDDIDHVPWEHTPYESFGVGIIDVQYLGDQIG